MQRIAGLADLPDNEMEKVSLGETDFILVRRGDSVHAFQATCPHAGAPLEQGAVCDGRIVCPWHKATFDIETGALLEPPALERLTRYPVEIRDGEVWIEASPAPVKAPAGTGPDPRVLMIIGGGAGGAAAIACLHDAGFAGRLMLVGQEPGPPYDRTALSKFVVAGSMAAEDVPALLPEPILSAVEVIDAEVVRLDAAGRTVTLADGRTLAYTAALAVPGGKAKPLEVPGARLGRVHTLRSRQDARALLGSLHCGGHAVVVGSSFIGLEVASSLREQQVRVTVVAPDEVPFVRQFGREIGQMFKSLHEANGVHFCTGAEVALLEGERDVEAVVLKSGERLAVDAVVVGIGVRPASDFIEGVTRNNDGAIVVNAGMKAADGLFVAGDVARFPFAGAPVRIEHWRVAQQQARIAAHNMLGGDERYAGVPFFWTYHYGRRFEYLGHAESWDEIVIRGSLATQDFIAFQLREGRVAGVIACQREHETALLAERMRQPLSFGEAQALVCP